MAPELASDEGKTAETATPGAMAVHRSGRFFAMRKNRYVRRAKISAPKFRQFLRCFALDMEATKIACLTRLNRNTVNRLGRAVRERMAETCEQEQNEQASAGEDASTIRALRILRTRIGRGGGWRIVSAQVLPGGSVRVQVDETAPDPLLEGAIPPGHRTSITPANHRESEEDPRLDRTVPRVQSTGSTGPLRTLDNFWGQAMLRLAKFKGVSRRTYHLHLKECQFRFNHRKEDLYALLLRIIRNRPLC